MAGSKFQYDESGGTFFYFLLSFLALVLIPCTYYFWPRKETKAVPHHQSAELCQCHRCQEKRSRLISQEPWRKAKQRTVKFLLVVGWLAFLATAYKVAHLERDYVDWDPFEILQIDRASSQAEIKKAYRKLSLIYHPDKDTGDERKFMQLTKAHAALTDDDARRNWEMYGNPDGPGAMSFGIALPSWIVEKENSMWVLGLYALVFMVALPTVVGAWWYRSIKYGGDQVLLDTSQLYYYFINKTPHMALKRALMVLAASPEFDKGHNNEVVERASDNTEVPALIKEIQNLGEKNKEHPLCYGYSVKARALLHAHLSRLYLPLETLEKDKMFIVRKCPYLIQEMVQCVAQLTMLAYAGRISRMPNLETIENVMKLCPMTVQALWDNKSPLLQLPHFTEDMLRHFVTRKRNIRSVRQLASLKMEERKLLLRGLNDDEYEDVMKVCAKMPLIEMDVKSEVLDDDDTGTITAGAIVTVTVTLSRQNLDTSFELESNDPEPSEALPTREEDELNHNAEQNEANNQLKKPPHPVWQKQKRKGKTAKTVKKKPAKVPPVPIKKANSTDIKSDSKNEVQVNNTANATSIPNQKQQDRPAPKSTSRDDDSGAESASEDQAAGSDSDSASIGEENVKGASGDNEDDDDEWNKFQAKLPKKEKILETKSKKSQPVHCPYFPEDKQEYWWVYIADRRQHMLITVPYQVTNLEDKIETQLKFTAPAKVGIYHYTVCLKSDSYLDMDQFRNIKFDVKEAKEVDLADLQWDISGDELEEQDELSACSDSVTDDDLESDLED